ncbi:hypothetical protein FAVG1_13141 [Fusarium avenaceum]|nr:hypothetical protein FAVG1_13141 [Fusarium avenaceum]
MGGVAWGPQEEDAAHCFYHFGVRSVWLPPDAQVSGLASGQSSTEPICRQPEQALAAVTQASPVRRHAGACGFVEVDRHYEPPAAEAGACKAVQRDTQWKSARSDHGESNGGGPDLVRGLWPAQEAIEVGCRVAGK